jgi:hypothetical protein
MKEIGLTYTAFKDLTSAKGLFPQYVDSGPYYEVFAIESNISWQCMIQKDDGSDQTDFETNYKASCNQPLEYRSIDGLPKVADARFVDNLSFYTDGSQGSLEAPANKTSYAKYSFSYDYTMAGIDLYWYGANWGDYMECEVGFYLNPSEESTFQTVSVFSNQYKIYQTGFRLFDVSTVKTIPPVIPVSGTTFPTVIRLSYINVGPSDAKAIVNLVGWR